MRTADLGPFAVGLVCAAVVGPTQAQQTTTIPSEPTPPPITSSYAAHKSAAGLIAPAFDAATYAIIRYKIDRWKKEHESEIKAVMPRQGGVLVVAYCMQEKRQGLGMPVSRFLLSVEIAEAAASKAEAVAKHAAPKLRAADPASPPRDTPVFDPDHYEPFQVAEWIVSGEPVPGPDPAPVSQAVRDVELLLERLEAEAKAEKERLDREWKEIDQINQRLNEMRDRASPSRSPRRDVGVTGRNGDADTAAADALRREQDRLRAWTDAEQREIERQRAAVESESGAIVALRQQLTSYVANWRCPSGLTLENCELPYQQNATRTVHLAEREAFRAERGRKEREIQQRSAALESRRSALTFRVGALPRRVEMRERRAEAKAEKARTDAERDAGAEQDTETLRGTVRDRLNRFDEDSDRFHRLRLALDAAQKRRGELAIERTR